MKVLGIRGREIDEVVADRHDLYNHIQGQWCGQHDYDEQPILTYPWIVSFWVIHVVGIIVLV